MLLDIIEIIPKVLKVKKKIPKIENFWNIRPLSTPFGYTLPYNIMHPP